MLFQANREDSQEPSLTSYYYKISLSGGEAQLAYTFPIPVNQVFPLKNGDLLALGAVFPTPRRLYAAEALLLKEQPSPAAEMQAAELVTQAIVAAAGRRTSARYKLAVAPELLLRTLRRTREEADQ